MSAARLRTVEDMLLGVELTLVGGIALLSGWLGGVALLWLVGLAVGAFGFWVTVDAYGERGESREAATQSEETDGTG